MLRLSRSVPLLLAAAACGAGPSHVAEPGPGAVTYADAGPPAEDAGVAAPPPAPVLLSSFQELRDALESGYGVRALFRYAECTLDGSGPGPDATGGMDIGAFEYFAPGVVGNDQGYLSFSESTLVLLGQHYVIDYVKVRVRVDGSVDVLVQYVDPASYAVRMNESFACRVVDAPGGAGGATFYRQ